MNKANNVIDLKSRRKTTSATELESEVGTNVTASDARPETRSESHAAAPVLDMTERRNEMLTHERRKVRRTILSEFIGAHIIVPERGLQRVTIYDISEDGIAFDVESAAGQLTPAEEVVFRVYLNQQTYFPFVVKVANGRAIPEEGVIRHGGMFVKGAVNDVALHHFVKFIETVSASLRTDHGDVMVSGANR